MEPITRKGVACHRMIVEGYLKGMQFDCENDCVVWLDALPNTSLDFIAFISVCISFSSLFLGSTLHGTFFQNEHNENSRSF